MHLRERSDAETWATLRRVAETIEYLRAQERRWRAVRERARRCLDRARLRRGARSLSAHASDGGLVYVLDRGDEVLHTQRGESDVCARCGDSREHHARDRCLTGPTRFHSVDWGVVHLSRSASADAGVCAVHRVEQLDELRERIDDCLEEIVPALLRAPDVRTIWGTYPVSVALGDGRVLDYVGTWSPFENKWSVRTKKKEEL